MDSDGSEDMILEVKSQIFWLLVKEAGRSSVNFDHVDYCCPYLHIQKKIRLIRRYLGLQSYTSIWPTFERRVLRRGWDGRAT